MSSKHPDFGSLHNHHERAVIDAVVAAAPNYPLITADLLPDVACVALNRIPSRYIRHEVDLAFYLTEDERANNEKMIAEAVTRAFEFVQARNVLQARR